MFNFLSLVFVQGILWRAVKIVFSRKILHKNVTVRNYRVNRNQRSNSSSTANGHLSEEGMSEDDDHSLAESKQNCTKDSSPSNDDDG